MYRHLRERVAPFVKGWYYSFVCVYLPLTMHFDVSTGMSYT